MNVVNRDRTKIKREIEFTIENLKLSALSEKIVDADGSVIYDLFEEFGVTQLEEVDFALDNDETDVRKICQAIRRNMVRELGALRTAAFQDSCLLFRFTPADYMETVNTLGLPMYAKKFEDEHRQKWVTVPSGLQGNNQGNKKRISITKRKDGSATFFAIARFILRSFKGKDF